MRLPFRITIGASETAIIPDEWGIYRIGLYPAVQIIYIAPHPLSYYKLTSYAHSGVNWRRMVTLFHLLISLNSITSRV